MPCLCKHTLAALQAALPRLSAGAGADAGAALHPLALWLARSGQPAAPWQPDPAWLALPLPSMPLGASAMATLSAFAQLRAMALAQFGVDLAEPGRAGALAQLVATVQARLAAMLAASPGLAVDASAWSQLSATLSACAQVEAALQLGLFPTPPAGPPLAGRR